MSAFDPKRTFVVSKKKTGHAMPRRHLTAASTDFAFKVGDFAGSGVSTCMLRTWRTATEEPFSLELYLEK